MEAGSQTLDVVAGIVRHEGCVLICQRPEGSHLPGLWEFPGGKVESGERPEEALSREIREELDIEVAVGPLFWETHHSYPDRTVRLRFYECAWQNGVGRNLGVACHVWVPPARLGEFEFLPADAPLIETLTAPGVPPPGEGPEEVPLEEAYRRCAALAASHYENFPVASRLLTAEVRPHVAAIYAFARGADDIADGSGPAESRLARLDEWGRRLEAAGEGRGEGPVFTALAETVRAKQLPLAPFRDLLSAFQRDVTVRRYSDYAALLDYCRLSANPIGRLMLLLHGVREEEALAASDAVCTALQIANHLQDIRADYRRGIVYLPQDELRAFGVAEEELGGESAGPELRALLVFQVRRTRALFAQGLPLLGRVGGGFGRELRAIWRGGLAALEGVERARWDVLPAAPRLRRRDKAACLVAALAPVRSLERRVDGRADERADRRYCGWLVRRSRSSFYLAFLALPAEGRRAMNAVYGFCRLVDDIADSPGDVENKRRELREWRDRVSALGEGVLDHPVLRELAWADAQFGLPAEHLQTICDGVEMDLDARRFATFEELRGYCEKVASAVGLACLGIFGVRSREAEHYAYALGIALQLTNILRDVGEDARAGRLYLPLEDLERFGVSEEEIRGGVYGERLVALYRHVADRARAYYKEAAEALPAAGRRRLFPARLMGRIYGCLLDEMEASGFPPGGSRPTLALHRKLIEAARCYLET